MIADRFYSWIMSLDDTTAWSHCGNPRMHAPHTHDIVVNEGVYPNCQCIGTPDLSQPITPPPTLE